MQIDYQEALRYFGRLSPEVTCPSQHPVYLQIDAKREPDILPVYFVHQEQEHFFYYPFHLSPIPGKDYFDIQSPYGFGGPVANTDDADFLASAWAAYKAWCREKRVVAEFVRFHPITQNGRYFGGEVIFDRPTVWIDLQQTDFFHGYSSRVRNTVRKAIKKEVMVDWCSGEEFLKWFPSMYEELMRSLHADAYYLFPENYYLAWLDWDQVEYALCRYKGIVIAGAVFYYHDEIMEYHLSAASPLGKELAATTLLLHEAAIKGKALGCKKLHLGGGTDSGEDNPLFFFKAGFSENRGVYTIGKEIHQPEIYEEMREAWIKKHGKVSNRILFYR